MEESRTVGLIGLGKIGSGLLKNLLKHGFEVRVLDLDAAKVEAAVGEGATAAATAAELASHCPRIILSLIGPQSVEAVLFGEEGIAQRASQDPLTVIDTTTIAPEKSRDFAQRLQQSGIAYLDAPITGGEKGAQKGELHIMVGGTEVAYHGCRDIFQAIGGNVNRVGDSGSGATAKMVNQLLMMAQMSGIAESIYYSEQQGVDFDKVLSAINPYLAKAHFVGAFKRRRKELASDPSAAIPANECHYSALFLKDAKCLLELAPNLPVSSTAAAILSKAIECHSDGPFPWTMKTGIEALLRQSQADKPD